MFDINFDPASEEPTTHSVKIDALGKVFTDCVNDMYGDSYIIHVNIRSMRKNFDELIAFLCTTTNKFDIIIVTEIWIKPDETDFYSLDNYTMYSCCRDYDRSGGGGTCLH